MSVELNITGLGPVPGIKNSKLLCRGRLVTKPEYQKWMKNKMKQTFRNSFIPATAAAPIETPAKES